MTTEKKNALERLGIEHPRDAVQSYCDIVRKHETYLSGGRVGNYKPEFYNAAVLDWALDVLVVRPARWWWPRMTKRYARLLLHVAFRRNSYREQYNHVQNTVPANIRKLCCQALRVLTPGAVGHGDM